MMTYNPFSLQNKTVLVTGASSGIGRATAIECSRMGATVCITGRNAERLSETFVQLDGEGHQQHTADLTDEAQVEQLVTTLPLLDGVVHSAGVILREGTLSYYMEEPDVIAMFRSNLFQIISLNSHLIQNKKLQSSSSIVHISSLGATIPIVGDSTYSMPKAALLSYTKTLATEMVRKQIRVNALLPAMVDTDTIRSLADNDPFFERDRAEYPLGYGQPEDVAWACIYLLSDAARWITGSEYIMDGGYRLRWK